MYIRIYKILLLISLAVSSCFTIYASAKSDDTIIKISLPSEGESVPIDSNQNSSGDFLHAVAIFSEEKFDQAHLLFSALKEENPDDDAINYYLGMCELYLGHQIEAEDYLSKAVAADTTNAWYLHALSSYYNAVGDRRKFAALGEKLVKISPSHARNPYTLYLLGEANYLILKDSLALVYFEKSLEVDPGYVPSEYARIDLLKKMGNYPQFFLALEPFFRNYLVHESIKTDYLTNIIDRMSPQFYWLWGKQVESMADLLVELYPVSPVAQYIKLRMTLIRAEDKESLAQCEKLAQAATASNDVEKLAEAYSIAGDIYYQQNKKRAAYSYYDKALKVKSDYLPVLNNYAYYLSLDGRNLRKALKMSAKTIELEPDNATYLDTYGWILYLLHRPAEAKPHFKRAMIFGGKDSAVVLEHYAKVLESLGDPLADYYKQLSEQKSKK